MKAIAKKQFLCPENNFGKCLLSIHFVGSSTELMLPGLSNASGPGRSSILISPSLPSLKRGIQEIYMETVDK